MTMRIMAPCPGYRIYFGTMVLTVSSNDAIRMLSASEFSSKFGRAFDGGRDFAGVMNADGKANNAHVDGATWIDGDGLYAVFNKSFSGAIRINYMIAMAQ